MIQIPNARMPLENSVGSLVPRPEPLELILRILRAEPNRLGAEDAESPEALMDLLAQLLGAEPGPQIPPPSPLQRLLLASESPRIGSRGSSRAFGGGPGGGHVGGV